MSKCKCGKYMYRGALILDINCQTQRTFFNLGAQAAGVMNHKSSWVTLTDKKVDNLKSFKKKKNSPWKAQKLINMSIDLAIMSQDMKTKYCRAPKSKRVQISDR